MFVERSSEDKRSLRGESIYLSTIVESENVITQEEVVVFVNQVEIFAEWMWVFIVDLNRIEN